MADMSEQTIQHMKQIAAKTDPAHLRRMAANVRERAETYARWAEAEEHTAAVWEDLATEREEGRL